MKFILALLLYMLISMAPTQAIAQSNNEGARIQFEQQEYDFGVIDRKGKDRECVFRFKNCGSEPLVILSAQTSCSCLKVEFSRKPIAVGATSELRLKLESRKMDKGIFHRVVQIVSNSTKGTEILTIKGRCEEQETK